MRFCPAMAWEPQNSKQNNRNELNISAGRQPYRCQVTRMKGDEYAARVPVALATKESICDGVTSTALRCFVVFMRQDTRLQELRHFVIIYGDSFCMIVFFTLPADFSMQPQHGVRSILWNITRLFALFFCAILQSGAVGLLRLWIFKNSEKIRRMTPCGRKMMEQEM